MKLPISRRLLLCASMIRPHARVADLGTDHGYLPIYLAQHRLADQILAADLREKPLEKARENAARFGVAQLLDFRLSDGLSAFAPHEMDTIVCAGMGGDLIIHILSQAPWLADGRHTLILQPQSSGQDVRRWLCGHGFRIEEEHLVSEGGFLYSALRAEFGGAEPLTPGQQFLSPALLASGDPLLPEQCGRLVESLRKTLESMERSRSAVAPDKKNYYQTALRELEELL